MVSILLIPIFLSFFITLFSIPAWIKKAKEIGLTWEDMNKKNRPRNVARSEEHTSELQSHSFISYAVFCLKKKKKKNNKTIK